MKFTYTKPEVVFAGKRIDVLRVDVAQRGGVVRREVVDHPGAVVILPVRDAETVLLIRNERYAVQETLWELPAGTLEEGEDKAVCAARELEEETGYTAQRMNLLCEFFSSPGFCNEILYVYLAEELSHVGQKLEESEKIEVVPVSIQKALQMIQEGTIRDAKTIAALLYFDTYRRT